MSMNEKSAKMFADMRDRVTKTLERGDAGHMGTKSSQTALKFIFEENGLLASMAALEKARKAGLTPGDFAFALATYQAIEMTALMQGTVEAIDAVKAALALADIYRMDLLKNTMTAMHALGKLPDIHSPEGVQLRNLLTEVMDDISKRAERMKEEADKPN